jgi:hypothetical protein
MKKPRLAGRVSYAPELSDRELQILTDLTDEQKLTVAHAIRLACLQVRAEPAGVSPDQER